MFAARSNPINPSLTDQAIDQAERGVRASQRGAHDALDQLSQAVQDVRDNASPVLSRIASQAESLARRGLDAVVETSHDARRRAERATETTVAYVKDEPIKSVLIVAAVVGLTAIAISALSRRNRY